MINKKRKYNKKLYTKACNRIRRSMVFIPCEYEEIDENTVIDDHYFKKPIKGKLLKSYISKVDYFHIHCNPIVNGTQMPDGCELILDCDFKDVYSYMRIIDDHKYLVAVYDYCNDIIDITNAQGKSLKQIVSE